MSPEVEKVKSLQWAIEELSKQKEELDGKLKIAHKREETGSLIEEVNAQRDALDQRISALHDGLKVSSELVDTPVDFLEDEISKINEKLEIAQERLQNLEQEQYLEELGRKLNRSHDEELSEDISQGEDFFSSEDSSLVGIPTEKSSTVSPFDQEPENSSQTMATTSNRIESEKTSSSRLPKQKEAELQESSKFKPKESIPVDGLEETAAKLGVEPEFLVEKGTKALLRMIARNGGQLRFPLEIDQVD